jgi:hypothetical protein
MDMSVAAFCVSIVSLLTSIIGWFVVQHLTLRNQEKALINSLRNDARIAITDAINDCIECLIEINATISAAPVDKVFEETGDLSARSRRSRRLRDLCVSTSTYLWIRRLEEFESLFPATAHVRVELLQRANAIIDRVRKFADNYEADILVRESPEISEISDELHNVISLAWDVIVYIQNRSIGAITGHNVPSRKPTKGDLPIVIEDKAGHLTISKSS